MKNSPLLKVEEVIIESLNTFFFLIYIFVIYLASPVRDKSAPPSPPRISPKRPQTIVEVDNETGDSSDELLPVAIHNPSNVDASQFPFSNMRQKGQLSRSEKARILNAGFKMVVDDEGINPVQVEPYGTQFDSNKTAEFVHRTIDFDVEKKDILRDNEITITLMGLSFNTESFQNNECGTFLYIYIYISCFLFGSNTLKMTIGFPSSVYFTFQFYNFPYCSTNRLHVYSGSLPIKKDSTNHKRSMSVPSGAPKHSRTWSHQSYTPQPNQEENADGRINWPAILYPIENDGSILCMNLIQ